MKTTHKYTGMILALAMLGFLAAGAVSTASASRVFVSNGGADIQVWVDDTWDVYPSYDDVVVNIRARRDCYATVYVVDTDGYVHVVYPFSQYDEAWIRGGRTYCYSGYDLGLSVLDGRGIAHIFAVSSPYPFDYSTYGASIFVGGFGFRIYGDPFVASRLFYTSLLSPSCRWDVVSVGFARFYIREWARYPHYLCRGHDGVHVRVGHYCNHCSSTYDLYRAHVADPYPAIHPRSRLKGRAANYAEIKRTQRKFKSARNAGAVKTNRNVTVHKSRVARVTKQSSRNRLVSSSGATKRREAVAGWSKRSAASNRPAVTKRSGRVTRKSPSSVRRTSTTRSRVGNAVKSRSKDSAPSTKKVTTKTRKVSRKKR